MHRANAKEVCDEGKGVGDTGYAVYLDFASAIQRLGEDAVRDRYGNLFAMYKEITGENPYGTPMRIYPAPHYTMGGLWVDYDLMSTVPGLFVLGEANFSDHGANRLGASALMQGLADGYFVVPYTVGAYLADASLTALDLEHTAFQEAENEVHSSIQKLLSIRGKQTVREIHWKLGRVLWDAVGMSREKKGMEQAVTKIRALRNEFWDDVRVAGSPDEWCKELEYAGRVADFLELGELMALDALHRNESCGGHFREESQTAEGEALRKDDQYSYVAAWAYTGDHAAPRLHKEKLSFDEVTPSQRSYK